MAAADVFVFPSLFEGSAVVTYEALACGLPSVVTPDAGSVVRDGIEGFVVPPRDVDDLAAAMEQLGNDPELRARMAAAARAARDGIRLAALSRGGHGRVVDLISRAIGDRAAASRLEIASPVGSPREAHESEVIMDELYFVYATAACHRRLTSWSRSSRKGSTRSPRSGCSWSATCRSTSIQAISYHEWAVGVRGERAGRRRPTSGRSGPSLWFLAVYHLGLGRRLARALPRPPRGWSPRPGRR